MLTQATPPSHHDAPAFSPDGHRLAYGSCPIARGGCDVYVIDLSPDFAPTGAPRRLSSQGVFGLTGIKWTRGGGSIIYGAVHGAGQGLRYLWRVASDGGTSPERIEESGPFAFNPATASTRDRLAFVHNTGGDADVYAHDGRRSVPLLTSSFSDFQAEYSNDGRRIAFISERSGERPEIWVAEADGSHPSQLTHGPGKFQGSPHWSPDGRLIAFDSLSDEGWHIWTIDSQGGPPQQITRDAGTQNIPTWSADGQWIYYSTMQELPGISGGCGPPTDRRSWSCVVSLASRSSRPTARAFCTNRRRRTRPS